MEITIPALAAALVIAIVVGGSLVSSVNYASRWWDNPTGQWIANARASLKGAEPDPRTLATPLPASIMPARLASSFPTDAPLLLLLRPDSRFYDGDGVAAVMNASGVRSPYYPVLLTQTSTKALCVANLPPDMTAPVRIRFPSTALYAPGAQVEVGLLLSQATKVEVTMVTPSGQVLTPQRFSDDELPTGPHTLRFPVPYGAAIRSVQVLAHVSALSCVAYGRVWAPMS